MDRHIYNNAALFIIAREIKTQKTQCPLVSNGQTILKSKPWNLYNFKRKAQIYMNKEKT